MNGETSQNRVYRVVADVFGIPLEQVSLLTSDENVENWDSLNLVNLMLAIESEFETSFEIDEVDFFRSVQSILATLERKGIC